MTQNNDGIPHSGGGCRNVLLVVSSATVCHYQIMLVQSREGSHDQDFACRSLKPLTGTHSCKLLPKGVTRNVDKSKKLLFEPIPLTQVQAEEIA